MQKVRIVSTIRTAGILPLVLCCAAVLNSCKEKRDEQSVGAAASAGETVDMTSSEDQLLEYMVFTVGDELRREAGQPRWRELVRDMRNQVETYYNALRAAKGSPERIVKLGLFLADGARELSAFQKAFDIYTTTLKDWEALPEATRNSVQGQRLHSLLVSGLAACLINQRKMAEALPYYEKALQLDKARFEQLAPGEGKPLPEGNSLSADLENAAKDLLSSYRCLAECQLFADDPEQARETLQTGQKAALAMQKLSTGVSFEFVHLLSTLGNLESQVGQFRKALAAWMQAAGIAEQLRRASTSPAAQAKAIGLLGRLAPSIKAVQSKLKEEQEQTQKDSAE